MKFIKKIHSKVKESLKENLSDNKIAVALSLGIGIGTLPVYGIHWLIATLTAILFTLNKPLTIAGTLFGNPITVPFIVAAQILIGELVLNGRIVHIKIHGFNFEDAGKLLGSWMLGIAIFFAVSICISYMLIRFMIYLIRLKRQKKIMKQEGRTVKTMFWWKFLFVGAPLTPPGLREFFNVFFAIFFVLYLKSSRRGVILNMKRIFKLKSKAKAVLHTFKLFLKYSFCLTDSVFALRRNRIFKHKVVGQEVFDKAKEKGKGVILLTMHLGSWDIGAILFSKSNVKLTIVRIEEETSAIQEYAHSLRSKATGSTIKYIYINKSSFASIEIINALRNGETVIIQGDRAYHGMRSTEIDFLGSKVDFPLGPYILGRISGAPILPVYTARTGFMKYEIRVGNPIYVEKTKNKQQDLQNACKKACNYIENAVKEFPHQWFCFYPFWKQDKNNPYWLKTTKKEQSKNEQ